MIEKGTTALSCWGRNGGSMELLRKIIWMMIPLFGIVFLLGNSQMAEAKKYYSLKNIGLSGCTTDNIDYGILSIRGNTVKYVKYKIAPNGYEWEKSGGVQTAKLTSSTKCYIGDSKKVSSSLKKPAIGKKNSKSNSKNKNIIQKNSDKRTHITRKNINTEKWIYRARKGTLKKYVSGRNNEIRVVRGKVTKIAVRLSY